MSDDEPRLFPDEPTPEERINIIVEEAQSLGNLRTLLDELAGQMETSPFPNREDWERDAVILEEIENYAADDAPVPEALLERLPDIIRDDVRRLYEEQRDEDENDDDIIVG